MHFGHLEHLAFIIVQLWCLLSLHLFINNMYNWVAKCRGRYQPIIAQRFVQKFIILALLCLYLFGRSQKETYNLKSETPVPLGSFHYVSCHSRREPRETLIYKTSHSFNV